MNGECILNSFHESLSSSSHTPMRLHHSIKSSLLDLGLQFELGLESHLVSGLQGLMTTAMV